MKKIVLLAASVLCLTAAANAQEAASFLDVTGDTRSAAMGEISTAMEASAFSIFDNAAAAPLSSKKFQVGAYYSPWAKELTKGLDKNNSLLGVGLYYTIGEKHSILAGVRYMSMPESAGYDDQGNPTGASLKPSDMSIDLGYAIRATKNLGVSLTAHYISSKIDNDTKAGAVAFDLGLFYRLGLGKKSNLDLAFRAANFGTKLEFDGVGSNLPGKVSVGGVYSTMFGDVHSFKAGIDLGYKVMGDKFFTGGAGLEYMAFNTIAVRAGYHFSDNKAFNYATVGAGVRVIDMLQADFAYLLGGDNCPLKGTYRVGLSVRF